MRPDPHLGPPPLPRRELESDRYRVETFESACRMQEWLNQISPEGYRLSHTNMATWSDGSCGWTTILAVAERMD